MKVKELYPVLCLCDRRLFVESSVGPVKWRVRSINKPAAQTLPDATPPIDKFYPSTKMAVTFELAMRF